MKTTNILSFIMTATIAAGVIIGCTSHEAKARATKAQTCLAMNIYHEARGESIAGQIAVAQVTMNRVEHKSWPDTVCEVVYQKKQFSWTHTIKDHTPHDNDAWETAKSIASTVYTGEEDDYVHGAVFYHADYVTPFWAKSYEKVTQIGTHIFYRK